MKTVHEFFTNARMDGAIFENSWFYLWMGYSRMGRVPAMETSIVLFKLDQI